MAPRGAGRRAAVSPATGEGTTRPVTADEQDDLDLDHAPGAAGGTGPMSAGPGAGAGPDGPDPGAGEPDGDPSRAGEDDAGTLGSPGAFLSDPTEGETSDDVWPGGADAEDEVDEDDLPD